MPSVNPGPATSSVVNTQPIVGSFDNSGNLITAYGPNNVPLVFNNSTSGVAIIPSSTAGIVGTTTNDNANTGSVGEYLTANTARTTATVTISIASPGVITWTAHALSPGAIVVFTTTGALPTGLTAGTSYYVLTVIDANNFTVAATPGGTAIATSGTQSGTQTGTAQVSLSTGTPVNAVGLFLTAGDWDVQGIVTFATAASTSVTQAISAINTTANTIGADGSYARYTTAAFVPGAVEWLDWPSPVTRVSLSAASAVYVVAQSTFTVSTQAVGAVIRARRVR